MGGVALFRIERLILSLAITGACDKQATSPRRKTGSFRSTMLTAHGADLRDCECWNRTLAPDGGHASALPATQCARAVHDEEPLQKWRAQGRPGVQCTRSLVCKSRKHTS